MNIYYDAESDYLEIRFGEVTESHYEKIAADIFARVDKKTREIVGYAIYNLKKNKSLKKLQIDIPNIVFNSIDTHIQSLSKDWNSEEDEKTFSHLH
jgi:uncharacterized protein YuzE